MFNLAVLIGVYSYCLFALGLAGLWTWGWIWGATIFFACLGFNLLWTFGKSFQHGWHPVKMNPLFWLTVIQAGVNLIGALGPELGFDALWYHLTIPKIWLLEQRIFFIDSGYFYYSAMPKLIDLLYVWGDIVAKVIHWTFGLLATWATYKLALKWVGGKWAWLAALIFYTNLVVGWQSTTAYIDLARAFFEVVALCLMVENKIYKSAIALGLAISTKLLAFGSLPIFLVLLLLQKRSLSTLMVYATLSVLPALPWFLFAYINTGNPLFPIFSGYDLSSPRSIWDLLTIWVRSPDPLNPIYIIIVPLVILFWKKLPRQLVAYCTLALVVWWLTPRTGGGRFILPYLPAISVLATTAMDKLRNIRTKQILMSIVVFLSVISITYRGAANAKYLPAIFGRQTKQEFLSKYLNPDFGHNLYYLPADQLRLLYK